MAQGHGHTLGNSQMRSQLARSALDGGARLGDARGHGEVCRLSSLNTQSASERATSRSRTPETYLGVRLVSCLER